MGAGGDRGTVLILRGPETMCVLVNLESAVCVPAPVASCPFKPQRRGCLLELVIYLGPVGGCCSRKSHVCGSVCYQPCVFLFTSALLLVELTKRKMAATFLSLGRDPRSMDTELQQPGRRVLDWGC